jgi:hypothetical protein
MPFWRTKKRSPWNSGDAQVPAQPAQQRVLFEVGFGLGEDQHLDAGDDQEGAEDVEHPGELLHQPDAGEDHAGAHDDGAEHAIEQHAALQFRRHGEVAEDHDEDEHVVHRQRLFDQVAGEELQRLACCATSAPWVPFRYHQSRPAKASARLTQAAPRPALP